MLRILVRVTQLVSFASQSELTLTSLLFLVHGAAH